MKNFIVKLTFWMFGSVVMFAGTFEPSDFSDEWEPDTLKSLSGRMETGINLGYASLNNQSAAFQNSVFTDYNESLANAVNFGAYLGYNITNHWNVRLQYKYATTSGSALYNIGLKSTGSNASSLYYVEDHYQFHQVGPMVFYRVNLIKEKVYLAPGLGASFMYFRNDGVADVNFIQQSNAALIDGYIGLEYFLSNHVGCGLTYYMSSPVQFNNTSMQYSESSSVNIEAQDRFVFSDLSFRLMFLF